MGIATDQILPVGSTGSTQQLSNGNGAQGGPGTSIGVSASDKLSAYGGTPVVQPSGPGQAAVVRGNACALIGTLATTQSPTLIANITTTEKGFTVDGGTTKGVFQIAAGDLVYLNKPTSQAGLGVGNVRVSAANVLGVTFSNFTAATITPTATQVYGIVAIRGFGNITASLSPAAVGPNTIAEQQFTIAGLRSGDKSLVQASKPTAQAGLDIVGMRVVADNTVGITFANVTAATITPTAAETYTFMQLAGLDAVNNQIVVQTLQSPTSVANATSAEQGLTVTGLTTTDTILAISKPTAQAGLIVGGGRVSAADTLGLTFGNFTAATITPTASQVYEVEVFRPAPVAPLVVYSQSLAPVSVAANTTAEQTFTVTGLVAGSAVWVNKSSATSGLGIAGVRVSAANTLAINYCNVTAAAITPPTETYVIGNFQVPIPDTGAAWLQSASPTMQQHSILANSTRAALVAEGWMAGA